MKIGTLGDLFSDLLFEMHDAEVKISKSLPGIIKNASDSDLSAALQSFLSETGMHIQRLWQIIDSLRLDNPQKQYGVVQALIGEMEEFIRKEKPGPALDAAIIALARRIKGYETASYRMLHGFAVTLNHKEISDLLYQTLREEKALDKTLLNLSRSLIKGTAIREAA